MRESFVRLLRADAAERRSVFEKAAAEFETQAANVEKDLWVCYALNFLFNERPDPAVRMYFKGGTSLSKCYGIIRRFSEDIDIGVYKADIAAPHESEIAAIGTISQQQKAIVNRVDKPAAAYFAGQIRPMLEAEVAKLAKNANIDPKLLSVDYDVDPRKNEPMHDVLLLRYPSVFPEREYVSNAVKIEGGARPNPEPSEPRTIVPYVASSLSKDFKLEAGGVVTVRPERTFWEKVLILHAMREMTEARFAENNPLRLPPNLNRYSRHYYDVHQIWSHPEYGRKTAEMEELAEECRSHKNLMFRAPDHRYELAKPGSYRLMPTDAMLKILKEDYNKMRGMIFGTPPGFDEVMRSVSELEHFLNVEFAPQTSFGGP